MQSLNPKRRGVNSRWRRAAARPKLHTLKAQRKIPPAVNHGPSVKSLSENCEECRGKVFWVWARQQRRSITTAGCDDRTNAAQMGRCFQRLGRRLPWR